MEKIRVCIVGAGSSYTPEIIRGIIEDCGSTLPVCELRMSDINTERLGIMAGLSERMLKAAGREVKVARFGKLSEALPGSDFVITQIRAGGMEARILDEKIPLKYGIIGQETTGPGGMFKALRTIPEMLEIAGKVAAFAPDAFILNYTNPSGIITEAVARHSRAKIIGLCSGIPGMQDKLKDYLGGFYPDIRSLCVGLNHLGFIHRIFSGSREITDEAIDRLMDLGQESGDNAGMSVEPYVRTIRAIPICYLNYYFYRGRRLGEMRSMPQTRGEDVLAIQEEILKEAALPGLCGYPEELKKRGGGGYAKVTLDCMRAIWNDSGAELACSVRSAGAVDSIDRDSVVELVCNIDRNGAKPVDIGQIPLAFRGLIQAVKAYETLTVEAAVEKSMDKVYQALLNHPLAGDFDIIVPLVDEMMKAHGLIFK